MIRMWVLAVLVGGVLACGGGDDLPGDELMGTFDFAAAEGKLDETSGADCHFEPPPAPPRTLIKFPEMGTVMGTYTLTFSRNGETEVFLTQDGRSREATFDGQVLESTLDAERRFSQCTCTGDATTRLVETLKVVLLSQSQDDALGRRCPADPFAPGAIPAPGSAPGIVGPGSTPSGFDAVRACGVLVDTIVPDEGCECTACTITFDAVGTR